MNKFAFLIHPRDIQDLYRRFPLAKFFGKRINYKIMKHLSGRMGFTVCSKFQIIHNQKTAEGYLIAVLLTAEQIMTLPSEFVRNRILQAILYAQSLNVNVIGLGGLIKSVTHGGKWLVKKSEVIASITHGDTYSVAIAEEGVEKLIALKNLKNPLIAIVGAYGMIGSALSKILARKYRLLLVGKNYRKLTELSKQISVSNCKISTNLTDVKEADLIVTATNHPKSLLFSEHLKKNAVVYDIAQPMNLSPEVLQKRPDILRVDGCYANIPNINLGFDMGPPQGKTFACLAETILQALEGEIGHHVGEIDLNYFEKIKQTGKEYNFTHSRFTCFSKPID